MRLFSFVLEIKMLLVVIFLWHNDFAAVANLPFLGGFANPDTKESSIFFLHVFSLWMEIDNLFMVKILFFILRHHVLLPLQEKDSFFRFLDIEIWSSRFIVTQIYTTEVYFSSPISYFDTYNLSSNLITIKSRGAFTLYSIFYYKSKLTN
jgi:hypothetical protein